MGLLLYSHDSCKIARLFPLQFHRGVSRSLRDSRTPVICFIGAVLLNVALDMLFFVKHGRELVMKPNRKPVIFTKGVR